MGKPEAAVEEPLAAKVKNLGGECPKIVSPGNRGMPDRLVLLNNQMVFVETKSPVGTLSAAQKDMHQRLRAAGARVEVISTPPAVDEFIRSLFVPPGTNGTPDTQEAPS